MNTKKERTYKQDEVLTEIYDFLPSRFIDDLYDATNSYFYEVIEGINERLAKLLPEEEQRIAECLKEFEKMVEKKLDKYFNLYQEYVNLTVWEIPDELDIRLDHYKDINMNVSVEQEAVLNAQLEKLRKDIINQKKLRKFLEMNIESAEEELGSMDEYSQMLSFLSVNPKEHNVDDIEFTMKLVKDRVDAIRDSIILAMRNLTRDLSTLDQTDTNSRAEYLRSSIEHQLYLFRRSLSTN